MTCWPRFRALPVRYCILVDLPVAIAIGVVSLANGAAPAQARIGPVAGAAAHSVVGNPGAPASNPLEEALGALQRVPAGRKLIARALANWRYETLEQLQGLFRWGSTSRTDAVLTRHFNPGTGAEERVREVTIYLKRDQRLQDLVLDIAHELVHATSQPSWDPYDPKLTPGRYIWTAIEGEGGEIEAVMAECQVGLELAVSFSSSAQRCASYLGRSGAIEKERVRRDFYRVGSWSSELASKLGSELGLFPELSPSSPRLFSSTGKTPYPVALLREFEEITRIACENSRKREGILAREARDARDRSPAAASPQRQAVHAFLSSRCP